MQEQSIQERDAAGIKWATELVGGRLLDQEWQARWRTQWILTLDTGGAEPVKVLLRGHRNPGYCDTNDADARARLTQEAGVLRALNEVPVRTPHYYGHNAELGWPLMEFIDGCEVALSGVTDAERRYRIYAGYVEELAQLHAWPVEKIELPKSMYRAESCADYRKHLIDSHVPMYRNFSLKWPEPTMEMGLQWSMANKLEDERPVCLGFGDVGPDQFLFRGDAFQSFIDVEYAVIGDPLQEMGQMRSRDVPYHSGRMTEHLNHYGDCYGKLTGVALNINDLQYWTIAGPSLWNVFTVLGVQTADPMMIDLPFAMAYEVQQKRCILEGIAEKYELRLQAPELPVPSETQLGPAHRALVGQLQGFYRQRLADDKDRIWLEFTTAMAATLSLNESVGSQIEQDNLEELSDLLGKRPANLKAGLARLQDAIMDDHMSDLEPRLNFLYRMEVRRDYLFKPMQQATGVSPSTPLGRFDD